MGNNELSLQPQTFSSKNIILEPVSMTGLSDFHKYSIVSELYDHLEFPPFKNISESKTYLYKLIDISESKLAQYWFIRAKNYDTIVGTFGAVNLDVIRHSVEIGYGVSPHYWRKGYFTEAANLILDYLYNELQLRRVWAISSVNNIASIIALEKLGFLREGIMNDYYRNSSGHWYDAVLLAKLKSMK